MQQLQPVLIVVSWRLTVLPPAFLRGSTTPGKFIDGFVV